MKKVLVLLFLLGIALLALALVRQQSVAAALDEQLRQIVAEQGLAPLPAVPTQDAALVTLGRTLFFDKELSGNRDVSCATCHMPQGATADALALSIGPGGRGSGASRQLGENRDFVPRNASDLFNRGYPAWTTMFWDARVQGTQEGGYETPAGDHLPAGLDNVLAAQAMFPVLFRDEMRGGFYDTAGYALQPGTTLDPESYTPGPAGWHDIDVFGAANELATFPDDPAYFPDIWTTLMERLLAIPEYRQLFQAAYPGVPLEEMGFQHAANALAAFQIETFTLVDSPWDRYLAGDEAALSTTAKGGALLFYGPAGCAACHSGPLLSDQQFHNIGVPQYGPGRDDFAPLDYGRYHATGDPADRFAFRTPPLRNVTLTGPWLHNGAYNNLEDVIRHHLDPAGSLRTYDGRQLSPALQAAMQHSDVTLDNILASLDPRLQQPPTLSDRQIALLLTFLESLTDPAAAELDALVPGRVPSGLPVGDANSSP